MNDLNKGSGGKGLHSEVKHEIPDKLDVTSFFVQDAPAGAIPSRCWRAYGQRPSKQPQRAFAATPSAPLRLKPRPGLMMPSWQRIKAASVSADFVSRANEVDEKAPASGRLLMD